MRVLHVLHTSMPVECGYSIRTDYILGCQRLDGLEVSGVTSARHAGPFQALERVNGIEFRRTPLYQGPELPVWREWRLVSALQASVTEEIRRLKPHVVHAHSPVLVGFPALRAAKQAGLPFVYEVRDLWENASVDRGKFSEGSAWYRLARAAEGYVVRRSGAVVAICEGLRNELASRVPDPAKLFLVGNGVDVSTFAPLPVPVAWLAAHGLGGKQVIAYAGSFQPYEGLPVLLRAMPEVLQSCERACLVIAGDGESRADLEALATTLNVRHALLFLGRVPHSEMSNLYAAADVLAYPRLLTRTTALTTPLKPLEAMAMERPVVASDVPGLRELVTPGERGLLFEPGNHHELAARCVALLGNARLRAQLGRTAREWVLAERQWPVLVRRYSDIYASAGVQTGSAA